MTRMERFWIWTARYSDEQVATVLVAFMAGSALIGGAFAWWVLS